MPLTKQILYHAVLVCITVGVHNNHPTHFLPTNMSLRNIRNLCRSMHIDRSIRFIFSVLAIGLSQIHLNKTTKATSTIHVHGAVSGLANGWVCATNLISLTCEKCRSS